MHRQLTLGALKARRCPVQVTPRLLLLGGGQQSQYRPVQLLVSRQAALLFVGRDPQDFLGIAVGDDQQIAMEMRRRLRLAGGAGSKSEQRDIVSVSSADQIRQNRFESLRLHGVDLSSNMDANEDTFPLLPFSEKVARSHQ